MKSKPQSILKVPYTINVPESMAEAIELCGGEESVAVSHCVQALTWKRNVKLQKVFLKRVFEATGMQRNNGESGPDYFDRVLSTRNEEPSVYTPVLQQVSDATPLAVQSRRWGDGKELAKMYMRGAQEIEAAGNLEGAASQLAQQLAIVVEPTVQGVALALKEREARRRREFINELKIKK